MKELLKVMGGGKTAVGGRKKGTRIIRNFNTELSRKADPKGWYDANKSAINRRRRARNRANKVEYNRKERKWYAANKHKLPQNTVAGKLLRKMRRNKAILTVEELQLLKQESCSQAASSLPSVSSSAD